MVPTILQLLALAALAPAPVGDLSLFLGDAGVAGDVVTLDETGLGLPVPTAGLQGIRLEAIDFAGRTELETFLPDRPRLVSDVPGAGRLVLPQGRGSVYRFSRPAAGGGRDHGLFLVGADGAARILLERQGVGPAGDAEPFQPTLAVAPDGGALLVATVPLAGGDLLEVAVATGLAIDRTPNTPPIDFAPAGLGLRSSWGTAIGDAGVLRFDRVPGATAQPLALPGAPAWLGGELAFSADASTAATIAGADATSAHVYTFGPGGPARRLGDQPAHISPAGFLPSSPDGPYLGLSHDGTLCTWRTEGPTSEAWVARVDAPGTVIPIQATADALFLDTLDEVGLVGGVFTMAGALVLGVGQRGDPPLGGIEGIDLYRVELGVGASVPSLVNLSLSSGDAQAPFLSAPSTIDPDDGIYRVPGADALILHDGLQGGTGRLLWVDLTTPGATLLAGDVKSLDGISEAGGAFLLSVRRELATTKRELLQVNPSPLPAATTLASIHELTTFERFAPRADGWTGVVLTAGPLEWLLRVHAPSGAAELLTYTEAVYGPTLGFTPGGRLALSIGFGASPPLFAGWGLGASSALYPVPPQAGFILP